MLWGLMTRSVTQQVSYKIEGVQCCRYPEPIDTLDEHFCGEYQKGQPNDA